jgi:N-acetyl sugar amidotransferase
MSTRPRISFDDRGRCNACRWAEEKQELDWEAREAQLQQLLERHRSSGKNFDCVVPVSGGKDGSYVAHTLKTRYGMHPLAVTVNPSLPLELGQRNLRAFADSGFNLIAVSPSPDAMRQLDRIGFEEMGFPYYGWLIAIHTAVIRVAKAFDVKLVLYGEDGEVEYGGATETAHEPVYGMDYQRRIYLEGGYEKVLERCELPASDLHFFSFPSDGGAEDFDIDITHWSYYENWDPYRNYLVAKQHCGLQENENSNIGTFTNFSQNDQALYALHTYIMFLKFGFGRANQDAAIEIRRGAMDRAQAVNLVNLYDGQFPEEFFNRYLDYYRMTAEEFDAVLDRWANRSLFEKANGRWRPMFRVE